MRELTMHELDLVSGGLDGDDEEIVVNGYRPPSYPSFTNPGSGYYPSNPSSNYGGGGSSPGTIDSSFAGFHLHTTVTNMTAEQQNAYNHLHDRLNALDARVQAMPNNEVMNIKLSDGSFRTITGAEVKSLWSNYSIMVDSGPYANGTSRGASTDANGITHFDANLLTSYIHTADPAAYQDKSADYLIFHELSHNTAAGKAENSYDSAHMTKDANGSYAASEKLANTIADAIEANIGSSPLYNATYGYDSANTGFYTPSSYSGGGSGGGVTNNGGTRTQIP